MKTMTLVLFSVLTSAQAFAGVQCVVVNPREANAALRYLKINIEGNGHFLSDLSIDGGTTVLKQKEAMRVTSRNTKFFVLENNDGERVTVSFRQEACKSELKKVSPTCYLATADNLQAESLRLPARTELECVVKGSLDFNFPNN